MNIHDAPRNEMMSEAKLEHYFSLYNDAYTHGEVLDFSKYSCEFEKSAINLGIKDRYKKKEKIMDKGRLMGAMSLSLNLSPFNNGHYGWGGEFRT